MAERALDTTTAARVTAPAEGLWRVARWPEPLAFPPPPDPLPDGELDRDAPAGDGPILTGNRFDDAHGRRSALYCSTTAEGAFGEVIARFRRRDEALALLASLEGEPDPGEPELEPGVLPHDWARNRTIGFAHVEDGVAFVDVDHSDTHVEVAREAPWLLRKYGLADIDRGVVMGPDRRVTRHIATYFAEQAERDRHLAGLRYQSRIRAEWECWALWSPAPVLDHTISVMPVTWSHPALRSAAEKLRIELA